MVHTIRIEPCACHRAITDMAEIALQARSLQELRIQVTDGLCRWIGGDHATHAVTGDGVHVDVTDTAGEAVLLSKRLSDLARECSKEEIAWMTRRGTIVDHEVIRPGRREELAFYREYLRPRGIESFISHTWWDQGRMHCVSLARTGRVRRLERREADVLDRLAPLLVLGERLHGQSGGRALSDAHVWAQAQGLSRAEQRVVDLVARGLTNREIGGVLGSSPNTVRNQLSSVYRKLGVSTRTELAFVLSSVEQGSHPPASARAAPPRSGAAWLELFGADRSNGTDVPLSGDVALRHHGARG
jgi:DNA-binding CsgD family transcriptional regulator